MYENLSETFNTIWFSACMELVGRELPVNYLSFDADANMGDIGYEVDDSADPIVLLDGQAVRILTIKYNYEEVIYAAGFRQ